MLDAGEDLRTCPQPWLPSCAIANRRGRKGSALASALRRREGSLTEFDLPRTSPESSVPRLIGSMEDTMLKEGIALLGPFALIVAATACGGASSSSGEDEQGKPRVNSADNTGHGVAGERVASSES